MGFFKLRGIWTTTDLLILLYVSNNDSEDLVNSLIFNSDVFILLNFSSILTISSIIFIEPSFIFTSPVNKVI